MRCPHCFNSTLKFVLKTELVFDTDSSGSPVGSHDVSVSTSDAHLLCPSCGTKLPVVGWDEEGKVVLAEGGVFAVAPSTGTRATHRPMNRGQDLDERLP